MQLWPGSVYGDGGAFERRTIRGFDCGFCRGIVGHLDEGFRLPCLGIDANFETLDGAVGLED